jgi:hypothetical protein
LGYFLDCYQGACDCANSNVDTVDLAKIKGGSVNELMLEGAYTSGILVHADIRNVAINGYVIN